MLDITPNTKIYILCPAKTETGGPEAVHQLVAQLLKLGHDANIVYLPNEPEPTPEAYRRYNVRFVEIAKDEPDHILIVPEIWTQKLGSFKRIQKMIWWLSVDNHFKYEKPFRFNNPDNANIIHLAQSVYAINFLIRNGAKYVLPLGDYINDTHSKSTESGQREDLVLYNPKKGFDITRELIHAAPELNWIPLANMTAKEVASLMRKSKVYVDFGRHPGRERIPREAALNGCCVIVGRRGSANFDEDVPIPRSYKVRISPGWRFLKHVVKYRITQKINDCVTHFYDRTREFDNYREFVKKQKQEFEFRVGQIFGVRVKG